MKNAICLPPKDPEVASEHLPTTAAGQGTEDTTAEKDLQNTDMMIMVITTATPIRHRQKEERATTVAGQEIILPGNKMTAAVITTIINIITSIPDTPDNKLTHYKAA